MTAACLTRLCWLFNAPCTLVDVTVGNFLRMCLVGMKHARAALYLKLDDSPVAATSSPAARGTWLRVTVEHRTNETRTQKRWLELKLLP
ncbi:hypothetical protein EVAR_9759_1 [Eumeta japonica]|uniref:Secreted protein n=1 Tax=Eumeta variegata TaxID=151549 RepID=A0A4C1U6J1_EUMVA|nr:hypothetical protein EVAR_9759_1 [Eumeta japonica]